MSEQRESTGEFESQQKDVTEDIVLGRHLTKLKFNQEIRLSKTANLAGVQHWVDPKKFARLVARQLEVLLGDLRSLHPEYREPASLLDLEEVFNKTAFKLLPGISMLAEKSWASLRWYTLSGTKSFMLQIKIGTDFSRKETGEKLWEARCTAWTDINFQPRTFPEGRRLEHYREVQPGTLLFTSGSQLSGRTESFADSEMASTAEGSLDDAITALSTRFKVSLEEMRNQIETLLSQQSSQKTDDQQWHLLEL